MSLPTARFWGDFDPAVAQSFSADQRAEIERVLARNAAGWSSTVGDLRLSFYWFFVRILWGREKRNNDRLDQESAKHPALTKKNAPVLFAISAGYTAFWYVVLVITTVVVARYLFK